MNIVLLGGPGSGKGTQAQALSEKLDIPHVSSGDIFRENLSKETPLGKKAQTYIGDGKLVPDEITIAMIRDRLQQPDCADGFILDGFPRTIPQAEALEEIVAEGPQEHLLWPFFIRVSKDVLLKRLSGRWICPQDGTVYHELFNPPEVPGRCDICGEELYQRADDRPEVQERRIEVYFEQTMPLIEYYRERDMLVEIDGEQEIEEVRTDLLEAIRALDEES